MIYANEKAFQAMETLVSSFKENIKKEIVAEFKAELEGRVEAIQEATKTVISCQYSDRMILEALAKFERRLEQEMARFVFRVQHSFCPNSPGLIEIALILNTTEKHNGN